MVLVKNNMFIGNRPKEMIDIKLKKLYFWLSIERSLLRMDPMGWHVFELGVMYPFKLPAEYEFFTSEHYRGFVWRFAFWFPIDTV